MLKRGERILGPYKHHSGWQVIEIDAHGKRSSIILKTEAKANRYIELMRAELALDRGDCVRVPSRPVVYIVSDGVAVKIGSTNDLRKRIASLQTGCRQRLRVQAVLEIDESLHAERMLHRAFASDRIRPDGEWFTWTTRLAAVAAQSPRTLQQLEVALGMREKCTVLP